MQRNVYFDGELAERYGESVSVYAKSVKEIVKIIEANDPTFKNYILECADKGVSFSIDVEGEQIEDEKDLLFPLKKGDVHFYAIPAGSKSGGAKLLGAVALGALFLIPGGAAIGLGAVNAAGASVAVGTAGSVATLAGSTALYTAVSSLAINLALTGLQQLMAPDPSTDEGPESYLYNADNQNIQEGDPMPLAYGRLLVPGRAVGFSVLNESTYNSYRFEMADYINNMSGITEDPSIGVTPSPEGTATGTSTFETDPLGNLRTVPVPRILEDIQ